MVTPLNPPPPTKNFCLYPPPCLKMFGKNKCHLTDWNQVFTEGTIISNGDPLASYVVYVTDMLLMYER